MYSVELVPCCHGGICAAVFLEGMFDLNVVFESLIHHCLCMDIYIYYISYILYIYISYIFYIYIWN